MLEFVINMFPYAESSVIHSHDKSKFKLTLLIT